MKRYDSEVGLDSTRNSPVAKKKTALAPRLLALAVGVAVVITLIAQGVIVINPVAVASMLVYVIAASVVLYFIYLFVFLRDLTVKSACVCWSAFILLVSAAFFWSAFEQKPTSFNLFANDYTNRMIGDFEIPAVWFQSINALFIILLAPVFSWAWPAMARKKRAPEQHHQVCYRDSVRGGGLRPDDAGGAERAEQRRRRRIAAVAGGQHSDADAGRTVSEPDRPGNYDPTGAGKNARPDDGAVVLRQRAG